MTKMNIGAVSRLKNDYKRLKRDPIPFIDAEFKPDNILEWHFIVCGPPESLYFGGFYHGKLIFPHNFPFEPPSIYMLTPNGRFNTNTRLCLSISDFHPDTWNPAWNVSTILTGLLSFMLENTPTFGSFETSDFEKRKLAWQSLQTLVDDKDVNELFPNFVNQLKAELQERKKSKSQSVDKNSETVRNQSNSTNRQQTMSTLLESFLQIVVVALFLLIVQYVVFNAN